MWQSLTDVEGVELEVDDRDPVGAATRLSEVLGNLAALHNEIVSVQRTEGGGSAARYLARYALTVQAAEAVVAAAVDYRCTIDDPPEEITGMTIGPGGDMVHQCFHTTTHCWDGTWRRIACPPSP